MGCAGAPIRLTGVGCAAVARALAQPPYTRNPYGHRGLATITRSPTHSKTMLYATLKLVHVLSLIVWIGGMVFAHFFLRPATLSLEPPQRVRLMHDVLQRFFAAVSVAVANRNCRNSSAPKPYTAEMITVITSASAWAPSTKPTATQVSKAAPNKNALLKMCLFIS